MTYDQSLFINRELSWLEFNARVLHEAFDERNQLLERLKFLAIYSTNLDEFYMVRVAGLRRQVATGARLTPPDGMTPQEQLAAIQERVSRLVRDARHCLHDLLLPALEEHGIRLVGMNDLELRIWDCDIAGTQSDDLRRTLVQMAGPGLEIPAPRAEVCQIESKPESIAAVVFRCVFGRISRGFAGVQSLLLRAALASASADLFRYSDL